MCGIAGIISRDGDRQIGSEMTRMLQSMKHRGPDSTGYALYGAPSKDWVMRVKLADANTPRDYEFGDRLLHNKGEIERRLRMPQPTVSKHLRVLREAGFVESTVDAQRRLYRLKPESLLEGFGIREIGSTALTRQFGIFLGRHHHLDRWPRVDPTHVRRHFQSQCGRHARQSSYRRG